MIETVVYDDPNLEQDIDNAPKEVQTVASATARDGKFMWIFTVTGVEPQNGTTTHNRVLGVDYLGRKVDWLMPPDVFQAFTEAGGAVDVKVEYIETTGRFKRVSAE